MRQIIFQSLVQPRTWYFNFIHSIPMDSALTCIQLSFKALFPAPPPSFFSPSFCHQSFFCSRPLCFLTLPSVSDILSPLFFPFTGMAVRTAVYALASFLRVNYIWPYWFAISYPPLSFLPPRISSAQAKKRTPEEEAQDLKV